VFQLEHEKLRVYAVALEFLSLAAAVIADLPRGHAHLADQLYRAALSVCLNIAEGAGEFSPFEKARFYRMGRRSATECAAVLDVCARLQLASSAQLATGRGLLVEVVAMLTALAKKKEGQTKEPK
jgi:four helix bundle protein